MSKRKRRRTKRSFPVRYASDYINVTQRPRHLVYDPEAMEGDKWFDNASRVRTVVGPKNNKEPKFNNTFMQPIPPTKGRLHHSHFDAAKQAYVEAEPTPRMEVQAILRKWESKDGRLHGIDEFLRQKYAEYRDRVMWLCFQGEFYCWLEETKTQLRMSCLYRGRQRALSALKDDDKHVTWMIPWTDKGTPV